MLQAEYTTFHGWMTAYLSSTNSTNSQAAQLSQDVQAYGEWMSVFLDKYVSGMSPSAAGPSASVAPTAASATPAVKYAVTANSSSKSSFNAQSSTNLAVYYGQ